MRSHLISTATLALTSVVTLLTTGCQTTGDPSTGGIFWSETKAQDRLNERQQNLERIERQTGQTQKKSAETQRKIDALQ